MAFLTGFLAKQGVSMLWKAAPWVSLVVVLGLGGLAFWGLVKFTNAQAAAKEAELNSARGKNHSLATNLLAVKRERAVLQRTLQRHQLRLADAQSRETQERAVVRHVVERSGPSDCVNRRLPSGFVDIMRADEIAPVSRASNSVSAGNVPSE